MGQKVHAKSLRLPLRRNWDSRWFASKKDNPKLLLEDYNIRKLLMQRFKNAAVPLIFIERAGSRVRVKVYTARPGVLIGRRGQELDKVRDELNKLVQKEIFLDVQEIKKPDLVAQLVADSAALQIARRVGFRRVLKKAVQTTMSMGAEGIFIQCSGRLGGADIARREFQRAGRVPRHTLREIIDYGFAEAQTVYGKIGIKCWICKKEDELI
jgi:small subunit ribosomal protein S3